MAESRPNDPSHADGSSVGRAVPSTSDETQAEDLTEAVERQLPDDMPPDVREMIAESVTHVVMQERMVSGPLPPPSQLAEYDGVVENGAERIMRMVERSHEQHLLAADSAQQAAQSDRRLGLWMGYSLMVLFFIGALVSTWLDKEWAAALFLGAAALGVVSRFIPTKGRSPTASDADL